MSNTTAPTTDRLLRMPEVKSLTGLQRSSIYDAIRRGAFPPAVRISESAVAWRLSDIQRWMQNLPQSPAIAGEGPYSR